MSSNRSGSRRDLYEVLHCDRSATQDDLRRAFRREASRHHPDKNPGDAAAERRFKEVNEAYQALTDPPRRALYDRFGLESLEPGFDPEEAECRSGVQRRTGPQPGDTLIDVTISAECAARGCIQEVRLPEGGACRTCRGTTTEYVVCKKCEGRRGRYEGGSGLCPRCFGGGMDPYFAAYACGHCHGYRWVPVSRWINCSECGGHGLTGSWCGDCGGDGQAWARRKVRFPPGVVEGKRVRLPGQGPVANENGGPTDVWVVVHIER